MGHDPHRVADFVRSGRQDNALGGCKFHSECAVGIERTAEIQELKKAKAKSKHKEARSKPRGKAEQTVAVAHDQCAQDFEQRVHHCTLVGCPSRSGAPSRDIVGKGRKVFVCPAT